MTYVKLIDQMPANGKEVLVHAHNGQRFVGHLFQLGHVVPRPYWQLSGIPDERSIARRADSRDQWMEIPAAAP